MKAAVLGIGTELTDGQIVNKNAAWISARLKNFGLLTDLHLVVPDNRPLILESLVYAAGKADIIFVTGGLGPTTDDFTRDLIAEWSRQELEFHPPSWEHLTERLTTRGFAVKEMQRQQCYFPKQSEVLINPQGTANAFYLKTNNCHVFVLPGPPREIEAIWENSIHAWLANQTQNLDPFITYKWDTLGLGESDIATLVEETLRDVPIEKGYRVHLPYVEVKLSFYQSEKEKYAEWVQKVDQVLAPHTMTRDGEDVAHSIIKKLEKFDSIHITDLASGSFLWTRLTPHLRSLLQNKNFTFSNSEGAENKAVLQLQMKLIDDFTCEVGLKKTDGKQLKELISAPFKSPQMQERRLQYFTEYALSFWLKNI